MSTKVMGRPAAVVPREELRALLRDLEAGVSFREVAGLYGLRPSLVSALAIVSGRGVARLHGMSEAEVALRRSAARLVGEKLGVPEPGLLGLDLGKSGLWELGQAWVMVKGVQALTSGRRRSGR